MAKLIKLDGTEPQIYPKDGKRFTYGELGDIIPGYSRVSRPVDYYDTFGDIITWDDDPDWPVNVPAMNLLRESRIPGNSKVHGEALVGTYEELKG